MAGFENYLADAKEIELEIERKGIVLGIDWADEAQVRALAREALEYTPSAAKLVPSEPFDSEFMAKLDLFGLVAIMLRTMEESAEHGFEVHGGSAWKALAKALWTEANLRKPE